MRVDRFEQHIKDVLTGSSDEIADVRTFSEAGYDKPYGLRVDFTSGASVFIQFVRTSPPGGEDFSTTTPTHQPAGSRQTCSGSGKPTR